MGNLVVVSWILPALRNSAAQVVMRCPHLFHNSLQVVGLHTVILWENVGKTAFPISLNRAAISEEGAEPQQQ